LLIKNWQHVASDDSGRTRIDDVW